MEFNPQFIHFHHLELHKFPISQILYYRTAIQELCIKYTKTKRFWIQICKFHMINDERRDMLQKQLISKLLWTSTGSFHGSTAKNLHKGCLEMPDVIDHHNVNFWNKCYLLLNWVKGVLQNVKLIVEKLLQNRGLFFFLLTSKAVRIFGQRRI